MKLSETITAWGAAQHAPTVRERNAAALTARYGAFPAFAANFAPARQRAVMQNAEAVMRQWRRYPSLVQCEHAYGGDNTATWIAAQLQHLFAKGEDPGEIRRTAVAILSSPDFRPMKVTELMVFAAKFYTGAFGKVYGKATGTDIMEALHKFRASLAAEKSRFDEERRQAEWEEWAKSAVTWEEYARQAGMEGKSLAEAIAEAAGGSGK